MGYIHTPTTSPSALVFTTDLGLDYLEYLPFLLLCVLSDNCKCKFDISLVKLQGRNGNRARCKILPVAVLSQNTFFSLIIYFYSI
jgi:hypothetical protein